MNNEKDKNEEKISIGELLYMSKNSGWGFGEYANAINFRLEFSDYVELPGNSLEDKVVKFMGYVR
jgi:hypothetical protein